MNRNLTDTQGGLKAKGDHNAYQNKSDQSLLNLHKVIEKYNDVFIKADKHLDALDKELRRRGVPIEPSA